MTKTSINFVTVNESNYRNFVHGGLIFFNKAGWSLHSKHPQDCQILIINTSTKMVILIIILRISCIIT